MHSFFVDKLNRLLTLPSYHLIILPHLPIEYIKDQKINEGELKFQKRRLVVLDETDLGSSLSEALTADIDLVLSNEGVAVVANYK